MMKRFLVLLPILLILAAASTLAVAWACAAWIEINVPGHIESIPVSSGVWETTHVKKRFGHTQIGYMRGPVRFDRQGGAVETLSSDDVHRESEFEQRLLAGWPWRAFRCSREVAAFFIDGRFGYFVQRQGQTPTEGGIELAAGGSMSAPFSWRALPYEPIWSGILANVIVHGAAWWLILIAPLILRNRLRRRRGRCPQCGYDLRGDLPSGCPECGWGRPAP